MTFVNAYRAGRCFNGAHRDAGTIIHLVTPLPANTSGYWGTKALCGVKPGLRGYGWEDTNQPVNCPKCIKKQSKKQTI